MKNGTGLNSNQENLEKVRKVKMPKETHQPYIQMEKVGKGKKAGT